jgi:hypothetical protein
LLTSPSLENIYYGTCYEEAEMILYKKNMIEDGKNIYYKTYNEGVDIMLSKKNMEAKEKEMIEDGEKLIRISEDMSSIENIFNILSKKE